MGLHRPLSWSAHEARTRQAKWRAVCRKRVKKTRTKTRPSAAGQEGRHRACCRCKRRLDKCIRDGCEPFTFQVNEQQFNSFRKHRKCPMNPVRYHTDCADVRCAARWGKKALRRFGPQVVLLGVCAYAHFNSLRTGGVVLPALLAKNPRKRWRRLRRGLLFCTETWGTAGKNLALYTPNNMSGYGFPRAASGDKVDSIVEGLQRLARSSAFRLAAKLLKEGVDTVDKFDAVRRALQATSKSNPGSLGDYHLHMVFSIVVAMDWIPARVVTWWPVARCAGTATALQNILRGRIDGRDVHAALAELWRRFAGLGELAQREHVGSLGAQLCFWKRTTTAARAAAAAYESRFQETTARWESDLADLRNAGIVIEGWHFCASKR